MINRWPNNSPQDEVSSFFFEAMKAGFAGGKEPQASPSPCYVYLDYSSREYYLMDTWMNMKTPNGTTHGQTIIWHKGLPIWFMQYSGHYPKVAIPLLKLSLLLAYERKKFIGGRGIPYQRLGEMIYTNHPDLECNTFANFKGYETIHSGEDLLGQHHYNGGFIR